MEQQPVNWKQYSPHLAMTVERIDPAWGSSIGPLFEAVMVAGAAEELEFSRPEGQSFNPRPARIAIITITDGPCRDLDVVAACLVASLPREKLAALPAHVTARAAQIASLARRSFDELERLTHAPSDDVVTQNTREAAIVALAIHLDFLRHRHLAHDQSASRWQTAIEQAASALRLAERCSPQLAARFGAWHDRAVRQRRGRISSGIQPAAKES